MSTYNDNFNFDDRKLVGYLGNKLIKRSGEIISWSPEMIKEFDKCRKDPIYLCKNYVKIVNVDKGIMNLDVYDYQEKIIKSALDNRYTIITAARQSGKTTGIIGFILPYIIFNSNKRIAILANKEDTAKKILGRIKLAYQYLPKWLQQGIVTWNKKEIELENGSSIFAAATSSDNVRGDSFNCVVGSTRIVVRDKETGFVKILNIGELNEEIRKNHKKTNLNLVKNNYYEILTENGFRDFYGVLETENQKTIQIHHDGKELICTPDHRIKVKDKFIETKYLEHEIRENQNVYDLVNVDGGNHYLTNDITSHNCIFLDEVAFIEGWEDFSSSVLPTISSGKETKVIMVSTPKGLNHYHALWKGAISKKNNYNPILVNWRDVPGRDEAWKKDTLAMLNGDVARFEQEYENRFMGSSGTLISGATLENMDGIQPLKTNFDDNIKVYKPVEKDHQYVLIADVSRGKGLDYSAFSIIDVSSSPFSQVCTFRDNTTNPFDYASIIHAMAVNYNDAHILVEINDIGAQIAYNLHEDFEYDNLIRTETAGRVGKRVSSGFSGKKSEVGITTSKSVKSKGCSMLKILIEQERLIVNDVNTLEELKRFSKKGDSYEAEEGSHDDMVMGLVLFGWLALDKFFEEMIEKSSLDLYREKSQKEVDDSLPIGFFYDGTEDEGIQLEPGEELVTSFDY